MAKTKKNEAFDLSECVDLAESMAGTRVDEAAGVVHDVVLMTANKVSKNRTKYSMASLKEAQTRYEGAQMYLDHPRTDELKERRGNRSVRDLGGTYKNLRVVGEGAAQPKLIGDLHLMEHNKAIAISIAKNPPKGTGLSLRDRGVVREESGVTLVEGFEGDAFSIDLVVNASLNQGLYESQTEIGGDDQMDMKTLTVEELRKDRKDLVEAIEQSAVAALKKQLEEAGVKTVEASKLVALAESVMPLEFKDAIKPAVMKVEVTLEEATKLIASQVALAAKVQLKPAPKDPAVRTQGARSADVEEGADKTTAEQFEAAFK